MKTLLFVLVTLDPKIATFLLPSFEELDPLIKILSPLTSLLLALFTKIFFPSVLTHCPLMIAVLNDSDLEFWVLTSKLFCPLFVFSVPPKITEFCPLFVFPVPPKITALGLDAVFPAFLSSITIFCILSAPRACTELVV